MIDKDKCFVCFEENSELIVCCHVCSPLICSGCLSEMNEKYEAKCTICNNFLPCGYTFVESGKTTKISISNKPILFYLKTETQPVNKFYSVKVCDLVIENILKVIKLENKFYLLNSNFSFNLFEHFEILYEDEIEVKSIGYRQTRRLFENFTPEIFVGCNSIVHVYGNNKIRLLFKGNCIFLEDFERVLRNNRKNYFEVVDNFFYQNLIERDDIVNCCCIL